MDLPVLEDISGLTIRRDAPMSEFTRFALGGPADLLVDVPDEVTFGLVWARALASGSRIQVIGAGSNLVVSDQGFRGTVIRYTGNRLVQEGSRVIAGAGAVLQDLVDFTIARGLSGMHTMTGIPGWVGGAVYG